MMRLPEFQYVAPRTVEDAASMLAGNPDATRLLAGGTDLLPNMKRRHQQASRLVTLRRVDSLARIVGDPGREMRIGAMTTLSRIVRDPVLRKAYPGFVRAAASISTPVLRNMGTLGGNLCLDTRCTYYNQSEEWRRSIGYCMKECGDTCWVAPGSPRCWAISAADSVPLLCAIGARVVLKGVAGERTAPLRDLYLDDGINYLNKAADEIVTDVLLPAATGVRSTYWKLRRRGSIDFPVLGVGAAVRLDERGRVAWARIHLGAVHSFPVEAVDAGASLAGAELREESIAAAARLSVSAATPMDNTDFTLQWRREMVERYVEGALRELAGLAPRGMPNLQGMAPFRI